MQKTLILLIALSSLLLALDSKKIYIEKQIRTEKNIKKALEKEQRYAKEKIFYTADKYDFKDAEVNKESLSEVKEQEVDDLDMDSVYD